MKKAVSSVIAFLKKKKEDFSFVRDWKIADSDENLDQAGCETDDRFSVTRLCRRCVLVYEHKTWQGYALPSLLQQRNNSAEPSTCDIRPGMEEHNIALFSDNFDNLRGFFDERRDQPSVSLTLVPEHVLRWRSPFPSKQNLGPHYPVFIWLRSYEKERDGEVISTYEDEDQILIKLRLDAGFSLANLPVQLPVRELVSNMAVWVLAKKFPKQEITLKMEEDLIIGYLADIFDEAFFHVPLSAKERLEKIDAIFQAVDEILEISARVIMTSGDSPETAITIKEVIIETATVLTSTAAESTATVGIETAAMALGQAAAGIAISVLVDVALTAGSVTRAKLQRDKGLITNSQFKSTVRRKLCDSGCQFIGGTTGTIVGQVLIPVPVVGAIVGGFFGSLIGVGVSKGIIKTSELIAKVQNSRAKAIAEN